MIDKSTSDNIKMLGVVMTAAIVMYHCGATASSNAGGGTVDLWLNDHVSIAFNQIGVFAMSYFLQRRDSFSSWGFLGEKFHQRSGRGSRRSLFHMSRGRSSQLAIMLR